MSKFHKFCAKLESSLLLRDRTDTWVIPIENCKVAYAPIPKAANTSIRRALLPLLNIDPGTVDDIHHDNRIPKFRSSEFVRRNSKDWLIFSVVRHPEERALSAWKNKLKDPPTPFSRLSRMGLKREDSFETFLQALADWPSRALNDHFSPQSALLSRLTSETSLEIFRIEEFELWWPSLRERLAKQAGILPGQFEWLNRSRVRENNSVTPSAKDLLFQIYSKDYQQFGYQP